MFYEYRQNNSGGSFLEDHSAGISVIVIIEAPDTRSADRSAEDIGIYFDGCDKDLDCSCCGDRWSPASFGWGDDDGHPVPSHYGAPIDLDRPMPNDTYNIKWAKGPEGYVHYADGRVVGFWTEQQGKRKKSKK